jgi:hemerythrin-like domain-containing protein
MEPNPIQTLYKEHEVISQVEGLIQNLDQKWIEDPGGYVSIMNEIIVFLKEYADNFHHQKEEDILFSAMRDHPDFTLDELLLELEGHHESFRDFLKKIQENLKNQDYTESYSTLKEYANDLLDHIAVENDELFVLAESILSPEELENIFFRFEDLDREIGLEKKKELEAFVLNPE